MRIYYPFHCVVGVDLETRSSLSSPSALRQPSVEIEHFLCQTKHNLRKSKCARASFSRAVKTCKCIVETFSITLLTYISASSGAIVSNVVL